ncbi:TPA: hypothetical protein ENX78_15575, partial [Candidatus Poribacteria bacterium]|nr:hypothetical protein [Candidatus Poribacteria bacterium]
MSKKIRHSEVAFMYNADKEIYKAYKATWVAWGGASVSAVQTAHELGMHFVGSMWTLTAGAENIHKRSDLRDAVSKDILLEPIIVPWLWDHTYEGTPSYFGCTNNPTFRQLSRERVIDAMKTGADGLHIDDHLGTAGSFWHGGCFCDYCIDGFRKFLADQKYEEIVKKHKIDLDNFNYRDFIKSFVSNREEYQRKRSQLPLTELYQTYLVKSAAQFVKELRKIAEDTKGGEITCSANTGIPNPVHLVTTPNLTHCVCEVEYRHNNENAPKASPISAYKVADAINKPVMATASGWNWAYAHANNNAVGLVRLWIAETYALGHRLMVPHRKWAFTQEKGTHWYQSKPEDFAYLYNFIRDNSELFDDYEPFSRIALIFPNKGIRRHGLGLFQEICKRLADKNLFFSVVIAGDDWIEDRLKTENLSNYEDIIIPEPSELDDSQKSVIEKWESDKNKKAFYVKSVNDIDNINLKLTVEVIGRQNIWVLPRMRPDGSVVCHILNRNYDESVGFVKNIEN